MAGLPDEFLDRLEAAAHPHLRDAASPWTAVTALVTEVRRLRTELEDVYAQLRYAEDRDETRDRRWQQALDNAMRQLGGPGGGDGARRHRSASC